MLAPEKPSMNLHFISPTSKLKKNIKVNKPKVKRPYKLMSFIIFTIFDRFVKLLENSLSSTDTFPLSRRHLPVCARRIKVPASCKLVIPLGCAMVYFANTE